MITWTDVTNVAPELSAVASPQQGAILAQANIQLDPLVWGNLLATGQAYLAAHLATLQRRRGQAGSIASQSVGGVSRSFAVPTTLGALGTTAYGAELERLIQTLGAARFGVT